MSRKVGALWKNESSKDKKSYLAGFVDMGIMGQQRVVIFKNELKEKDNQPDYHILLSENNDKPVEETDAEFP